MTYSLMVLYGKLRDSIILFVIFIVEGELLRITVVLHGASMRVVGHREILHLDLSYHA